MAIDHNQVVQCLYRVSDPIGGADIVASKRVRSLKITESGIHFELVVTGMDSATRSAVNFDCQEKLKAVYPDAEVHIHMITDKKEQSAVKILPQVEHVLAIASGKGGVGKSTITASLARSLVKKGFKVGVIDADLYGPSMPKIFDLDGEKPNIQKVAGKPKLIPLQTNEGIFVMSIGFLVDPQQAVVLRGPRLSGVLKQFITDTIWPELDYLLIDLPPGTGDIQLTVVQSLAVTGAIMVTTPQKLSYIDALKAMNMFLLENIDVPILGVVENMAWFSPEDDPQKQYYIFGSGGGERLAKQGKTKVLAQVPLVMGVGKSCENITNIDPSWYEGLGVFGSMTNEVLKALELRNQNKLATQRVAVK